VAETYRFDPNLVLAELPAIQEWCRTNGLDPLIVPMNATVVIDEPWLTVDQYVRGIGGLLLNEERTDAQRTTRVVPLIARPELASLKPAEQGEGGVR
jgi:hypothetical protein